jgi:hypothetical protein
MKQNAVGFCRTSVHKFGRSLRRPAKGPPEHDEVFISCGDGNGNASLTDANLQVELKSTLYHLPVWEPEMGDHLTDSTQLADYDGGQP